MPDTPKILPLKALRYNLEKVKDLSRVVTPPYDVINPEMQEDFYARSPYNFVRVDLTKETGEARYESAQKTFRQWLAQKVFLQDEKPALTFHHHTFKLPDGTEVTRKGFFCLRRLEDFSEGGIKPHEKTLEGPKTDRLKLMRALKAQLSPVFSLYSDSSKEIDRLVLRLKNGAPFADFKTAEGERHQLWREDNPTVCQFVDEAIRQQPLFIADGHHRFETALNYRNECRQAQGRSGPYDHVLMYLSNLNDEGLVILPIHRALHHLPSFDLSAFVENLKKHFKVMPFAGKNPSEITARLREEGAEAHAFIMVTQDPTQSYLLSLSHRSWKLNPVASRVSPALLPLDVTVLHRLVFEEVLRISPEAQGRQENIIYWKDTQRAINETLKGNCEVTFLLNPTAIGDMERVAMAGSMMPQKSTYFYPKVPSGLVVYQMM